MNAFRKSAEEDLLNDAQFDPVFDAEGNLVDIVHLEISTDRSRGIRAMEELAASTDPGDAVVYGDGWTGRWKRILNTPAPGAAHTIKQTKRWDSQSGSFVNAATLILPFEVVWTLFDRLFFGRYSIDIQEVTFDSEDVVESSAQGARNLPGRVFYARARIAITIHLENGHTRVYSAVGVAYDSVRASMTGNVYAVNSARRMAEKGAVSDAKREALATIGRVFTRAYEDGNAALRAIEEKILEKIRRPADPNKTRVVAPSTVAAPRRNAEAATDAKPSDDGNAAAKDTAQVGAKAPAKAAEVSKAPTKATKGGKAQAKVARKPGKPAKAKAADDDEGNVQVIFDAAIADQEAKEARAAQEEAASAAHEAHEANTTAAQVAEEAQQANPTAQRAADAKVDAENAPQDEGYRLHIGDADARLATPEEAFFRLLEAMGEVPTAEERQQLLDHNKDTLLRAERDDRGRSGTFEELLALVPDVADTAKEEEADGLPDFDEPAENGPRLAPKKETGEAILAAYEEAFARPDANVDAVLMANVDWAKRLTKRQTLQLAEMAAKAKTR